jgi:hypothetical protein
MAKFKALAWLAFLLSLPLSATTLTIMVGSHGIVVAADSKFVNEKHRFQRTGKEETVGKFALIQGRIVLASLGVGRMTSPTFRYEFETWVTELETRLPKDVSVEELGYIVEAESAKVLGSVPLDEGVKKGVLKNSDPVPNVCDEFVQYVIAGYQGGSPRIILVRYYINWDEKKFVGPVRILLYPSDQSKLDFRVYTFGIREAVADSLNSQSYAYKLAMLKCPTAYQRFVAHQNISIDETVSVAKAFVEIEEGVNPDVVGGPVQTAVILPDGRAYDISQTGRLPDVPKQSSFRLGSEQGGTNGKAAEQSAPLAPGNQQDSEIHDLSSKLDVVSDTQGVDFGPYLSRVLDIVRGNWYILIPEKARAPEMKRGILAISFIIMPDGKVQAIELATRSGSGDVSLDRAARGAITASNPFPPLPSEFHGPYLGLRFWFYYNPQKTDLNDPPKTESH